MKVKIESFGGIVGHMQGERSASQLSVEQLSAVEKLTSQPLKPVSPGPTPHYRVTVTDHRGEHQVNVSEEDMPEALASIPSPAL
jgi:hypothetical protein